MTGIERLRGYARRMDELHVWPGGARLREIAGQIEREHDAEVADSPYDAILPEDREAATWVRSHGGLDTLKVLRLNHQNLCILVSDIAEYLGFDRSCNDHEPEELFDALDRRLMPEGIEWPRYEDGESVRIGHDGVRVVELFDDEYRLWGDGEPVSEEPIATGLYGERVVLSAKPEPRDSWERVEEDALSFVEDNAGIPHDQDQMERDMLAILRRCRALAERERGE